MNYPGINYLVKFVQSRYCCDLKTCLLYGLARCPHSGSILVHKLANGVSFGSRTAQYSHTTVDDRISGVSVERGSTVSNKKEGRKLRAAKRNMWTCSWAYNDSTGPTKAEATQGKKWNFLTRNLTGNLVFQVQGSIG